jgi:hypothetical protein
MLYYICRLNDQGQWEGLRSTSDKGYSEQLCDYYCELYPNAYIDILTHDEYQGGKVKWQQMAIN